VAGDGWRQSIKSEKKHTLKTIEEKVRENGDVHMGWNYLLHFTIGNVFRP
jgi:hypothetical protein